LRSRGTRAGLAVARGFVPDVVLTCSIALSRHPCRPDYTPPGGRFTDIVWPAGPRPGP
jgi:hypothetical protein